MSFFLPFRPFIKVYISLLGFFMIFLIGTAGYMILEHFPFLDALYMTVVTISTVGFEETRPLTDTGRIFTIILIIANLGTFTYFVTQLSSYFLDGEFLNAYKLYKMKKAIEELQGHVIICGFGRNGREAARIFHNGNKEFVVIESSNQDTANLPYPVSFYLQSDATRDEVLLQAGIKKARALIATLPNDADNLFVVLTARELNPSIKIITRASHDSSVKKFKTAGANNVIMPDKIGGAHMATLVLSPDIEEFVDLMSTQSNEHFNISEITSTRTCSLAELDSWKKTGATILGLKTAEGEFTLNPGSETVLRAGNRLIAMGSQEQLDKLKGLVS